MQNHVIYLALGRPGPQSSRHPICVPLLQIFLGLPHLTHLAMATPVTFICDNKLQGAEWWPQKMCLCPNPWNLGVCLIEKRVSAERIKDLVIGSSWSIPVAQNPMAGVGL